MFLSYTHAYNQENTTHATAITITGPILGLRHVGWAEGSSCCDHPVVVGLGW
jgi:hypothetical protein